MFLSYPLEVKNLAMPLSICSAKIVIEHRSLCVSYLKMTENLILITLLPTFSHVSLPWHQ